MPLKFKPPKCPVCKIQQKSSSEREWKNGNYACRCNSWDYNKITQNKPDVQLENCVPLSDDEVIKFTIIGHPGILKNNKVLTSSGILIPSKVYLVWASRALKQLGEAWHLKNRATIGGSIQATMLFYRGNRRQSDLSNLYQGVEDCLQSLGIIINDHIIESHDGSRKLYDKDNPRIEITLTKFKEEVEHDKTCK